MPDRTETIAAWLRARSAKDMATARRAASLFSAEDPVEAIAEALKDHSYSPATRRRLLTLARSLARELGAVDALHASQLVELTRLRGPSDRPRAPELPSGDVMRAVAGELWPSDPLRLAWARVAIALVIEGAMTAAAAASASIDDVDAHRPEVAQALAVVQAKSGGAQWALPALTRGARGAVAQPVRAATPRSVQRVLAAITAAQSGSQRAQA